MSHSRKQADFQFHYHSPNFGLRGKREIALRLLASKKCIDFDPSSVSKLLELGKTELSSSIFRLPVHNASPSFTPSPVMIAHYGNRFILVVDGQVCATASKFKDSANLTCLRKKAKEFGESMSVAVLHVDVPEILSSYSDDGLILLMRRMGYFLPTGSIFQRLAIASIALVENQDSKPHFPPRWASVVTRAARRKAIATTPIWTLRGQFCSYRITFDQMCEARSTGSTGVVWEIPIVDSTILRVELF